MQCKNILDLTRNEKQKFLDSFDVVLSDCDGVIWMLSESIPNTGSAIMLLKKAGKDYKFISNNSMRTDQEYIKKLTAVGVKDVQESDIVHPVKTILNYLKRHIPNETVYSLCSHEVNQVLREKGIEVKTMEPLLNLGLSNVADVVKPNDKVSAVIIDLNFNFTYGQLARAKYYLDRDGCELIVGCSDDLIPVTKDFTSLGISGFIEMLSKCTGKKPTILGKPGHLLGAELIEQYQIKESNRALFIGDNLIMDIGFAKSCGFQTLLVLTGATNSDDFLVLSDNAKPDYLAQGMSDFVEFFKDLNMK